MRFQTFGVARSSGLSEHTMNLPSELWSILAILDQLPFSDLSHIRSYQRGTQ